MTPPSGRRRAAPIRAPASGGTIRPRPPAAGRADCPGKAIATAAAIARAPPPLAARRRSAGSVGTRGGVRLPAKAARPPWRGPAPPITAPARGDIRHAAARRLGGGSRIGRRNGAAPRRRISIHRSLPRCPEVWRLFFSSKGRYDSQPRSPFYIGSSPGVATKSGTIGPGLCSPPAPAAAGVRAPILAPAALGELTAN